MVALRVVLRAEMWAVSKACKSVELKAALRA